MIKNSINFIIVSVTILLCTFIIANTFKNRAKTNNMISVFGLGTKDFVSDLIVWSGSFSRKQMDYRTAYADLDKDRETVKKYLISKGIKENEIVFSSVDISKETESSYDKNNNYQTVFTGYRLTQVVNIESHDVEKVETVSREITELINLGVEFYSNSPLYYYTKLSELKLQMIAMATEDGRKRAETIATNAGASLGDLRYANTDIFQITGQYANEDFTYGGVFNTASKNKTATITIKMQYDID